MISDATQWRVVAWYDSKEQADIAVAAILTAHPRAYEFSALLNGGEAVWREKGENYGARNARV